MSKPTPVTEAHVYRHRFGEDIPNPQHAAAVVLSTGPWVLVYGNDFDGWREFRTGYNAAETAVADGEWLIDQGMVVVHPDPKADQG